MYYSFWRKAYSCSACRLVECRLWHSIFKDFECQNRKKSFCRKAGSCRACRFVPSAGRHTAAVPANWQNVNSVVLLQIMSKHDAYGTKVHLLYSKVLRMPKSKSKSFCQKACSCSACRFVECQLWNPCKLCPSMILME